MKLDLCLILYIRITQIGSDTSIHKMKFIKMKSTRREHRWAGGEIYYLIMTQNPEAIKKNPDKSDHIKH